MRTASATCLILALSSSFAAPVAAQVTCNLNAVGPDELVLTVPGAGSDFDLGWKGKYHDLPVPGGARFAACLTDCDTTTDPVCNVAGYAGGQTAAGRPFTPPIPIAIGGVATCVVTTFQEPFATGTANIQTGDIDVDAHISGTVFLTTLNAVCPVCSGTNPGDGGTCSGGATPGAACTTDDVITVQNATAGNPYRVSRDCLPTGASASVAFSLNVTTSTSTVDAPCPGQSASDLDDCGVACGTGNCTGAGNGSGVSQNCCTDDTTKRCFPDPVARTGVAAVPAPAWPDLTYPKSASETIVSAFCAPAAPPPFGALVNGDVGLAGPAAFVLPADADWLLDPTPTTVTTTSTTSTIAGATTTTLPSGCTGAADCGDGDPCTEDQCNGGLCSNPPLPGIDGAQCRLAQITPATLCGDETIHAKLLNTITKKLAKANTLLGKAEAAPNAAKRAKALKKARAALQAILKKAAKFGSSGKITPGCAAAIADAIGALQQAIPTS